MRELPVGSSESFHIHCCESQSIVLTDAWRCFPCILPCQGSEACAGELTGRRLFRKRQGANRTAEGKHVRYQRCSKQLGTKLARAPRKLGLRDGAQFKKPVPQQERKTSGLTHEDDFVVTGTKESLLELKKQLESVYPTIASIIGAGSTTSIKELNRRLCWNRQGYCINTALDTLTFSSRVWGLRMETQCKIQLLMM